MSAVLQGAGLSGSSTSSLHDDVLRRISHGHQLARPLAGWIKQPLSDVLTLPVPWSAQKDQLDRLNRQALNPSLCGAPPFGNLFHRGERPARCRTRNRSTVPKSGDHTSRLLPPRSPLPAAGQTDDRRQSLKGQFDLPTCAIERQYLVRDRPGGG